IFSPLMVFLIISLSFKSGWAGLIGAIPLGLTIMLNFMVMGFAGIRLDLVTSIVSSVAIGVGIDYTIHFMETYRALRMQSSDLEAITKETFKTSGKGIITNAIAVGLGFVVLLLSKFIILRYIGVLVAIVMFTSSALAMTIIPGVLNTFDPKFMWSKEQRAEYDAKINR
ncbi:MAG: MMPL family transporter, partial [Treponema sp.]|nr:MMPL family transporter [Treponema sp.]